MVFLVIFSFLFWVLCKVSGPTFSKSTYWFLFALPPWVPMAPEVMLFVWGSEVVPISVKKALLSLIPTHTRMQGSSPQPQPGQPPFLNRTLLSFCQEVNEQTPKGEGGPLPIMICMTVIVWPPMGGSWLVEVGVTREWRAGCVTRMGILSRKYRKNVMRMRNHHWIMTD